MWMRAARIELLWSSWLWCTRCIPAFVQFSFSILSVFFQDCLEGEFTSYLADRSLSKHGQFPKSTTSEMLRRFEMCLYLVTSSRTESYIFTSGVTKYTPFCNCTGGEISDLPSAIKPNSIVRPEQNETTNSSSGTDAGWQAVKWLDWLLWFRGPSL
jgi:hypothetical protein